MQLLTSEMYKKQEKGYPVSTWNMLDETTETPFKDHRVVKHVMSSDIFSVDKKDSIELVINIMKWKNIHHMPVIKGDRELIGLLTWTDVKEFLDNPNKQQLQSVSEIMKTNIVAVGEYTALNIAKKLIKNQGINCLPVVNEKKLVGMITSNDL